MNHTQPLHRTLAIGLPQPGLNTELFQPSSSVRPTISANHAPPDAQIEITNTNLARLLALPSLDLAGEWSWAIEKANSHIAALKENLFTIAEKQGVDISGLQVCLNGSMASGLFTGPKPLEHSLNLFERSNRALQCADGSLVERDTIKSVIEADIRVVFPHSFDPTDAKTQQLVINALGGDDSVDRAMTETIYRWGECVGTSHIYQYHVIDNAPTAEGTYFEIEVSINSEMRAGGYIEIADLWDKLFTPEEVRFQSQVRETLRALGSPLEHEFNPTKKLQIGEARWRLISSLALSSIGAKSPTLTRNNAHIEDQEHFNDFVLDDLPLHYERPTHLDWIAEKWLAGEQGNQAPLSGLDRPSFHLAGLSEERITAAIRSVAALPPDSFLTKSKQDVLNDLEKVLSPPKPPAWTKVAEGVQQKLQQCRCPSKNHSRS